MPGGRRSLILIRPIHLTRKPDWPIGPLPLSDPTGTITASTEARATYFTPKVARILYGADQEPTRWHRFLDGDPLDAVAVELLVPDPDRAPEAALGIVHVTIAQTEPAALLEQVRLAAHRRGAKSSLPSFDELISPFGFAEPDTRTFTVAFLSTARRLRPPFRLNPRLRWSPHQAWLWHLASRTNIQDFPPDPEHAAELLTGTVVLSADWRGLIARDGAAFVALRRDRGANDPFLGFAQLYTHTAYLDALLLGMFQRTSVEQLITQSAIALDAPDLAGHLEQLERRVTRFRSIYWLRDASGHHGPANDILNAYHAHHALPERFNAVLDEIADLSRTVQTYESRRIGATLGVLTIVGLPFGAALETLQALDANTLFDLLIGLSVAFLVVLGLLATRVGRLLIHQLRSLLR